MKYNEKSKITSELRRISRFHPAIRISLNNAIHPTEKGPRDGCLFICAKCGLCFKRKEVQVDHIQPVVPIDRPVQDWNEYIERLFCSPENLQVLCKPCHQVKCDNEQEERNENRL